MANDCFFYNQQQYPRTHIQHQQPKHSNNTLQRNQNTMQDLINNMIKKIDSEELEIPEWVDYSVGDEFIFNTFDKEEVKKNIDQE